MPIQSILWRCRTLTSSFLLLLALCAHAQGRDAPSPSKPSVGGRTLPAVSPIVRKLPAHSGLGRIEAEASAQPTAEPSPAWWRRLLFVAMGVVLVGCTGWFAQRAGDRRRAPPDSPFESEVMLRRLCETVTAAVFVFQGNRMLFVNPAAAAITGYSREELLGMDFWAMIHPEFQHLVRERGLARQEGEDIPDRYEVKIVTKNGQTRWVDFTADTIEYCESVAVLGTAFDITKRKAAEAALRESEETLRSTIASMDDLVFVLDERGVYCDYHQPPTRSDLYVAPDMFLGKSYTEVLPPTVAEQFAAAIADTKATGAVQRFDYELELPDGLTPFEAKVSVRKGPTGQFAGVTVVARNLTEQRQATQAIQQSEQQYRAVVEDQTEYICRWLPGGNHTFVNGAYCRCFGKTREELLACSIMDLIPAEHHDRVRTHLATLTQEQPAATHEHRVIAADGQSRWHQWTDRAIFNAEGDLVEYQSVGRDITRSKTAEERLRRQALVFENMYDAVLLTDRQGRIAAVNSASERMLGYAGHELIGENPEMLNPPAEGSALTERIRAGIESDGRWTGELTFVRKDGTRGICEATIVPLRNESGQWIGNVAVNREITQRKAAEADKAQLEAQLLHSRKMQAVGTLASGIAHDFENLLAAIFAYTEIAKDTLPDGHASLRPLEKVEETARQARGVTNALLTFSHRTPIQKSPINLARSVEESLRLLRRLLPASIEIVEDLPGEADPWIAADESRIQQILLNLALNARDAMPNGGLLRVSLTGCAPATGRRPVDSDEAAPVVLVVEDTGSGMTAEVRSRMFEPFFTTKARGQGTGLGLSLVLGIVEDLDGQIDVESRPGEGTRVRMTLPRCEPLPATPLSAVRPRDRHATGGSVLVVQRNQHVRSLVTSALRASGHAVIAVPGVQEALDSMRGSNESLDLAICDLDDVGESTISELSSVSRTGDDLQLILLAGTVSVNLRNKVFRSARLLRKPFPMDELTALVNELIAANDGDSHT